MKIKIGEKTYLRENLFIVVENIDSIFGRENDVISHIPKYYARKYEKIKIEYDALKIEPGVNPSTKSRLDYDMKAIMKENPILKKRLIVAYEKLLSGDMLYRYLGITSDEQIGRGEYGKPMIVGRINDNNTHFNLSHSNGYVVLAVSDKLVGVDIEQIERMRINTINRILNESERKKLNDELKKITIQNTNLDEAERFILIKKILTKYWTLYEAEIKLVGCGFSKGLQKLDEDEMNTMFIEMNNYLIAITEYK